MVDFDRNQFAIQFTDFVSAMKAEAETYQDDSFFLGEFTRHFEADPSTLPIVTEYIPNYDHVNLQKALSKFYETHKITTTVFGFQSSYPMHGHTSISALLPKVSYYQQGPTRYQMISIGDDDPVTVYLDAVVLLSPENGDKLALMVSSGSEYDRRIMVEIMGSNESSAQKALATIRDYMIELNAYRGKVLSVHLNEYRQMQISVHNLPDVERNDIILQAGVLNQVERLTVQFAERAQQLKAAGRHLKRGLLLYGPPGTGKTYTAMYLASIMKDRTIVMMTGAGMGSLESAVALARTLSPSMVVLEDVDLIGEERSKQSGCSVPLLFELLNQMDGLASDIDMIFLLTTNRPEILEPALASRPGRIDQAIEIPLPDPDCRRRLFDLYGQNLTVNIKDMDSLVSRTEGASAAFIKELFRRAALYGDMAGDGITITDKHVDDALQELLARGGQLTQSLLGFKPSN